MQRETLASSTAKIAESTLKVAFGTWAEKSAAKLVDDAISESSDELMSAIISNAAKEIVGGSAVAIAGPLLKLLLRLTDVTSTKLDKMMRQPYKTGMDEVNRAFGVKPSSAGDRTWQERSLAFADSEFAKAFTFAEGTRQEDVTKLYISFVRALVALSADARQFARTHFETALVHANHRLVVIEAEIEAISRQFRQWTPRVTDGREYVGASGLYSRRKVLRAQSSDLVEFIRFVELCMQDLR